MCIGGGWQPFGKGGASKGPGLVVWRPSHKSARSINFCCSLHLLLYVSFPRVSISFLCFSSSRAISSLCLRCSRWSFSASPTISSFCFRASRSYACLSSALPVPFRAASFEPPFLVHFLFFGFHGSFIHWVRKEGGGTPNDMHRERRLTANDHRNFIGAS